MDAKMHHLMSLLSMHELDHLIVRCRYATAASKKSEYRPETLRIFLGLQASLLAHKAMRESLPSDEQLAV